MAIGDYLPNALNKTITTGQLQQTGNVTFWPNAGTAGNGFFEPYPQRTITTYPAYCTGEIHVFGCEHADKCKCGKAKRKPEPAMCPYCGKAHG